MPKVNPINKEYFEELWAESHEQRALINAGDGHFEAVSFKPVSITKKHFDAQLTAGFISILYIF